MTFGQIFNFNNFKEKSFYELVKGHGIRANIILVVIKIVWS